MLITVYIPFGDDDEAQVEGNYTPARAGCQYLRNGDPGYPSEPSEFEILRFRVGGIDIYDEIANMYKQDRHTKKYVNYIDSVYDILCEKADDTYKTRDCFD